eukprot:COSAG02_NODE_7690_length_2892_cov_11.162822_5_plen_65_part_00
MEDTGVVPGRELPNTGAVVRAAVHARTVMISSAYTSSSCDAARGPLRRRGAPSFAVRAAVAVPP